MACPLCLVQRKRIMRNIPLFSLLIIVCVYALLKLYTDRGEGTRFAILNILGAPLILSAYPLSIANKSDTKLWRTIVRLIFYAFLLEIGLAIIERVLTQNILGWNIGNEVIFIGGENNVGEFRSTALYGHPLYNALMVSSMMAFILISQLKEKYKYPLWGLGYVAILCFNTRGSIVGNALLLLLYIGHSLFLNKGMSVKSRKYLILASIIFSSIVAILFLYFGYGNRLLEMGLFDDSSAQVRIDIWSIFDYVNFEELLWGMSHNDISILMYRGGLYASENFWIDQVFRLGLVFFTAYWFTFFAFVNKLYKGYTLFEKVFTLGAFVLIASTNNSLSSNYLALLFFLLLIVIFNPNNKDKLFSRRFVN